MPIENEYKYVLKNTEELQTKLLADGAWRQSIEQLYLQGGARFRCIREPDMELWDFPKYWFTYKIDVNGQQLEIETEISEHDYELAKTIAVRSLNKIRFKFSEANADWDVDFLTHDDGVYFGMAEAEVDPGEQYVLPDILREHILLIVPQTDNSVFSNAKLCDPEYARVCVQQYLSE